MTIRVPRPEDPELQRLWDEARRACEARSPFWQSIAELAAMRDDIPPERRAMSAVRALLADADCCVGDRSQCRCQPSSDDPERERWLAVWHGDDQ